MNRSRSVIQLPVTGCDKGELIVPGTFHWPGRGAVACPADALIGASLDATSRPVRRAPGGADGVLYAASYLERDGRAVGFAVAAHRDDTIGREAARRTVQQWADALRSRRVLVAAVPGCAGSCGAGLSEQAGPPVPGARAAIPSQGAAGSAEDPVGAGCGLAAAAAADVRQYAARGDTVVLVGRRPSPPSLEPLAAQAPGSIVFAADAADVAGLRLPDAARVSFVVRPGTVVEEAMQVVAALRRRFPLLRGHHFDILCHTESDRVATLRAAADGADAVLVLGRTTDRDTQKLIRRASALAEHTYAVDSLRALVPAAIAEATTIALIPARTAPVELEEQVCRALSGLGPMTVFRRAVTTRPEPSRALPAPHGTPLSPGGQDPRGPVQ
ncbi:hypothetical protein H9Y04_43855 [Streptomyces sp. TRM66268-LWL]|uniref:4-hydroxy-3-methylbut-2-enyl diphosphate reductase n=1 Tax=Streptomyces polyasparticus TaxID=2767826 RepID=A0ABR7SVC8_9ACTN|nr:hypothetical protein [Streptomyces polyasparticus]MBC9719464.1 hypothetical protein [Streptomyces polyasparticus]